MKINKPIALAVAGALALAGCAGSSSDDGETTKGALSAGPGFDPDKGIIRVGAIVPLSGPVAPGGEGMLLGLKLYAERVNAQGGIAGKYKLEIVAGDSAYEPQKGLAEYNKIVDDVVAIGAVLGSPVVQALAPQAKTDEMLLVPGADSSDWLRQPNLLPVRPTYEAQFANGLAYALSEADGDHTVCSLIADDAFGESVKRGVDHAVEKESMSFGTEVSFPVSTSDFTPQISRLKSKGCSVVAFGGSSGSAVPAMSSAVQLDFEPAWVTHAGAFAENLIDTPLIDYISQTWLIAAPGAEWGDTSVAGMVDLVEDFEAYAPKGSKPQAALNVAGYTYGMAIEALLEAAVEQGDVSPVALLELSHSDLEVDFKGLSPKFTYGPVEDRQAPSAVNIFRIDPTVTGGFKVVERDYDSEAAKSFKVG